MLRTKFSFQQHTFIFVVWKIEFQANFLLKKFKLQFFDLNFRKFLISINFHCKNAEKTFYIKLFFSHHRRCFSHAHSTALTPPPFFMYFASYPSLCAASPKEDGNLSRSTKAPPQELWNGSEGARLKTKTLQTVEEENKT